MGWILLLLGGFFALAIIIGAFKSANTDTKASSSRSRSNVGISDEEKRYDAFCRWQDRDSEHLTEKQREKSRDAEVNLIATLWINFPFKDGEIDAVEAKISWIETSGKAAVITVSFDNIILGYSGDLKVSRITKMKLGSETFEGAAVGEKIHALAQEVFAAELAEEEAEDRAELDAEWAEDIAAAKADPNSLICDPPVTIRFTGKNGKKVPFKNTFPVSIIEFGEVYKKPRIICFGRDEVSGETDMARSNQVDEALLVGTGETLDRAGLMAWAEKLRAETD